MASDINLPGALQKQIGASGTYFFQGYITAEEYAADLQGKYGLQAFDVMRKSDATCHAALNICKQPILGADWQFEAASGDPADQQAADLANYEFFQRTSQFSFYDCLRQGLSFLDFGFYVGEKVFQPADRQGKDYIGLAKIGFRKQRSILKWQTEDGKPGIVQIIPNGGSASIPRGKLLVCVNDQEGENYFGVSLLRYAYKPWKIKDGLEIMNAIALEKLAVGIPYLKKNLNNQTTSEQELEDARRILRQQRANEEAFWEYPDSMEVGWTDMKGQSTKDVVPSIEYQDRQILLSVLGQFLLLGQSCSGGSRAVSADHSRLFIKALESVAKQWQDAFQRDVVEQWAALNFSQLPNGAPRLVYTKISDEEVKETTDAVSTLMTAGALQPDAEVENRLRKMLNLPELSDVDKAAYQARQPADKPANSEVAKTGTSGQAALVSDLGDYKRQLLAAVAGI
jgi:hypothetical protein